MSRANTSTWLNSNGEGSYGFKRQRGKDKPGNASNSHPSHNSAPTHTNTSQLFQTYQYGILGLPTNILMQIVTCLKAEELLFLARTTKHFRRVLMKRSSACIWRRALEDLEGLPPCPPTMTEPQYIALIFTEDCSSCGGRDMFGFFAPKLEADLLVRLCKECLEDKVVARNEIAPEIRDFVALKERGLLSDVEAVSRQLADLKATPGGRARLPAWKQDKLKQLADRRKRGGRIMQFLQRKAGEDKRAMKLYQQAEITRRLMVQGWSTEHMVIPKGSTADAQWTMYTHGPYTLKIWTTPCLELNRILMDNARERRQEPRWVRLEALWDTVKADLVRPAGTESTPRSLATAVSEALHIKPILEFSDALEWPVIKELLNTDHPLSEMQARFVQKRPAIDREVTAWCARIKTSLVDVVRKSLNLHRCMPYTPASRTIAKHRSNDPLQNLPLEMQFLLRADTIFAPYEADSQDCPSLHFCGYETYMRDLRRRIGYKSDEHWRLVNDSRFMMHSTAPTIARALLGALGRPLHTTILELEALDQRFVCGRCDDEQPKTWIQMIKYYLDRQEEWRHIDKHTDWFTNNNIAAHNVHDLKSGNPKPLVRLRSHKELPGEPSDTNPDGESGEFEKPDHVLLCGPCLRASKHAKPMSRFQAMRHLREMHEISESQLGNPEADLRKLKKRNYRVIPIDCLEEDGEFLHDDDDDDDGWWELGSQGGSADED